MFLSDIVGMSPVSAILTHVPVSFSSQPKSMFNRCVDDETFLSTLIAGDSLSYQLSLSESSCHVPHPLLIIDARPFANACVNKVAGAGFENTSTYYTGCQVCRIRVLTQ